MLEPVVSMLQASVTFKGNSSILEHVGLLLLLHRIQLGLLHQIALQHAELVFCTIHGLMHLLLLCNI